MSNQKDMHNDRQQSGSGNVANDPQKTNDAGKKSGPQTQGGQHQADSTGSAGQRGGSGNVANDPNRADSDKREKGSQQK